MSEESIRSPSITDEMFYPGVIYFNGKYDLKFKEIFLK